MSKKLWTIALWSGLCVTLLCGESVWSRAGRDSVMVNKKKSGVETARPQKRSEKRAPHRKPVKRAAPGDSATARQKQGNAESSSPAESKDHESLPHFVPITDRWEGIKPPPYELNVKGKWYDPYNQNKLKGDYPIFGQNTFLLLTASSESFAEAARVPMPSGVSTNNPQSLNFFGDGDRLALAQVFRLSLELYHGQVAFRPRDWEFRATGAYNRNYLDLRENNNTNINPANGSDRYDRQFALQELSFEKRLLAYSEHFDFVSLRLGIQRFNSDFRGFIFNDFNLGGRLFGSFHSNRYQYNLAYFGMLEKDTNSELNTVFDDRTQEVYIANLYRQDLFTLGYTGQISFHYNKDRASYYLDDNGFPVRPALIGASRLHEVNAYYLGWTGDGHFGRWNVNHALYQVFGNDTFNPLANRRTSINAQMAAFELSYDVDWKRYRISALYASGDPNPLNGTANGFDAIVDQPFFAGGPFSYWNVQAIGLLGVRLVNRLSPFPDLTPNKFEGQANFVNPGIWIANAAFDAEVTPKIRLTLNASYLRFANTASLQQFLNQPAIRNDIGIDYGLGIIYRPFLNNNAIITFSATGLTPLGGFQDIYDTKQTQYTFFSTLVLTY